MMKCTGRNCPMQNGTVDPAHCLADECPYVTKPLTNADRIRVMTDEELARFIARQQVEAIEPALRHSTLNVPFEPEQTYIDAKQEWLDWLKQEVEDG